jgi:hypothetical protein
VSIARLARPIIPLLALPAVALIAPSAQAATAPSTQASASTSTTQASTSNTRASTSNTQATASSTQAAVPGAPASAPGGGPIVANVAAMATDTQNWAGYVTAGRHYRYVAATFTVPRINCAATPGTNSNPTLMADWVGLDGLGSSATVEQDGITAGCGNSHSAAYYAWYEMYPKAPVYPAMSVSPGNTIQASVYYSGGEDYQLVLRDLSNNEGFTRWERCGTGSCANSSAEVITESPGKSSGGFFRLADFGTTSFRDISITDGVGQHGPFTSPHWQSAMDVMVDRSHQVKAAVGGLTQDGHGFSVFWRRQS